MIPSVSIKRTHFLTKSYMYEALLSEHTLVHLDIKNLKSVRKKSNGTVHRGQEKKVD